MRKLDYYKRFTYVPNEIYDHMKGIEDAAGGDIDLAIFPAMTGEAGTGPALQPTVSEANDEENPYVAIVTVKAMNKAKTKVLEFFNGVREVKVAKTSTSGTFAVDSEEQGANTTIDLNFENGVGTFSILLGGTWANNETITVTVDDDNVGIMGYTVKKNNHLLIKVQSDPVEG